MLIVAGIISFLWTSNHQFRRQLQSLIPFPNPTGSAQLSFTKFKIPQREAAFFSLKPTTNTTFGLSPKSSFVLSTLQPVDTQFVESHLKSTVPVKVTSVSDREFNLTPSRSLALSQAVQLSLSVKDQAVSGHTFDRNYGWAYQTQGKFRVTNSLPGDKKKDVPVNTGIEIVFSQDDYKDPQSLITISPSVKFRTERHATTYAIVPLQPLSPRTIYTVVLKKGLDLSSRIDPISDDFSFTFQTQDDVIVQTEPSLWLTNSFLEFSPSDKPLVKVYTSNWKADDVAKASVFKFTSGPQFLASRKKLDASSGYWYNYFSQEVDTSSLTPMATFDLKPVSKGDQYLKNDYLQFPDTLPSGFYLVKFRYGHDKNLSQLWLQSTNVSGYASVARSQTLVWANNLQTGAPISNASVKIVGDSADHFTSDNGVSVFSTPSLLFESSSHYLSISNSEESVYLPINSLQGSETAGTLSSQDYWSYLYHERSLYKPTDTLYFWGIVRNRDTDQPPSTVSVNISSGYSVDKRTADAIQVPVNSDGTYIGHISFTDLPQGWYNLEAKTSGLLLTSSGFQISDYQKPEMKIEVASDKKAVFAGEKVHFTSQVSFFDNTPVKNVKLNAHEDRTGAATPVLTNDKGQVKYDYLPNYDSSYYPRYESLTLNPALAESSPIEGYGSVYVFGSRLSLNTNNTQVGNTAKLEATVNRINLDGINSGTTAEYKGAVAPNTTVILNTTKTWYEKVENGTYYDFVEKITRPSYSYNQKLEKLPDQKLTTDSSGKASYSFTMEKDRSYEVTVTVNDENNRPASNQEYYYYYEGFGGTGNQSSADPLLSLNKKDNLYNLDENVDVTIQQNGKLYNKTEKNRFLFITAHRGHQDFFTSDNPEVVFPFSAGYIPNVTVAGVIFTGSTYLNVSGNCEWSWRCGYDYPGNYFSGVTLRYNQDQKKLDLQIHADKTQYQPRDIAKVTVSVTQNGQSVSGAGVNLVLVDQALAAIGGVVTPSALTSLYSDVSDQVYYVYYTHKPPYRDTPQAEKGGGGGDKRELFKDTPFFGRSQTDANGLAEFTFTLPDNLTTWIIYSQSATSDLKAGQAESSLVVTKDFFITSEFPREFLLSDSSYLTVSGYGTALKSGDSINYQAIISQGSQEKSTQQKVGPAFSEVDFPFPSLPLGDYQIWAKGTLGSRIDGIISQFKIIDSRISFDYAQKFDLTTSTGLTHPNIGITSPDKLVYLTLTDTGKGQYFYQLHSFCYTSSNRVEKRLAQVKASQALKSRFRDDSCTATDSLSSFQGDDGGIGQVTWAGSDLATTAWSIYIDPSGFDKTKLIDFFEKQLTNPQAGSMPQIYSAWGLTLLGRPHLVELQTAADTLVNPDEKIMAGIALATTGQLEKARDIYYDILADFAYQYKPYLRIQRPGDETANLDHRITDTSYALLLGDLVEHKYNDQLYSYLRDFQSQTQDAVIDLSKIAFIEEELSRLPQSDTRVSVTTSSLQKSLDLTHGDSQMLTLTPEEVSSLKVNVNAGKAEARLQYSVGAKSLSTLPTDNRLHISRTYKKANGEGKIYAGDIIEVKLNFDYNQESPLGSYQILDFLPSGMSYLSSPSLYGLNTKGWVTVDSHNRVTAYVYNSPYWQDDRTVIYYARAATPGTYVAEPAIFQSALDVSVFSLTPSEKVSIELAP